MSDSTHLCTARYNLKMLFAFWSISFSNLCLIQRAIGGKNEPFYPMHIGLLGSVAEVSDPCSMPYPLQQFWLDRHNLYHVYLLQFVVDIFWLGNGWIFHNKNFMIHYLTPSKVLTFGNEFDFQSNLLSFYYNLHSPKFCHSCEGRNP